MKKNFKFLAVAAIMLATMSCSKEQATPDDGSVNGAATRALITINQSGTGTRAAVAAPTTDEKAIKNVTLYIFNASQSLENKVTFTVGEATAGKEIQTSTGNHYFLFAINTPSTVAANATTLGAIALGEHISAVSAKIMKASSMANVTTPIASGDGFFMTNTETPIAHNLVAGGAPGAVLAANTFAINIGRAMAKVNVEMAAPADAKGVLSSVQYTVVNNPVSMNLFPVLSGTQLQTPLFSTAYNAANYFPVVSAVVAGDFKTADGSVASESYAMENANASPAQGTSTMALIKGVYTPKAWFDNTGAVKLPVPAVGDTYYRIGIKNGLGVVDTYGGKGIYNASLTQAEMDTELGANNPDAVMVAYTGGVNYYPLYLADDAQGANIVAKRTVKRNSYFYVTINSVDGPGANTPGGVITDPTQPLETDTYIKASITILPWTVINQNGNI